MADGQEKIGPVAASLMDQIERDLDGEEDHRVDSCILLVRVLKGRGEEELETVYFAQDNPRWKSELLGLLELAKLRVMEEDEEE